MKSRRRLGKLRLFLVIIFYILSIQRIIAQIRIKERVEIAPQQISADHAVANGNNNSGDSIVVTINAKLDYGPNAVTAINPQPVSTAYPICGQNIGDRFVLIGGDGNAVVGINVTWGAYPCYAMVTNVYLCDFGGGSGYAPGDYTTFDCDGPGETDLVVHVSAVSGTANNCMTVSPAQSPIYYGDTTMLLFQGNYAWDQPFNVQLNGDGTLFYVNADQAEGNSVNAWWPLNSIYYQAPEPPYNPPPGPIITSIRKRGEIINKSNKLSASKFRDTLKSKLMNLQNKIGIANTDRVKINDILKRLKALDESSSCPGCTIVVKTAPPTSISLTPSSQKVKHNQIVNLTVVLKDKRGHEIDPNNTNAKVNFFAGGEAEQFGEFAGNKQHGLTLTNISYKDAYNGSISFTFDGNNYMGKFPLGISIGVSIVTQTGLLSDVKTIYLIDKNTKGVLYTQVDPSWADSLYDGSDFLTINDKGCTLSDMAMTLKAYGYNTDPGKLNAWMKEHQEYDGLKIMWNTIDRESNYNLNTPAMPVGKGWDVSDNPAPLEKLDDALSNGGVGIVQVYNPTTGHAHWVLVSDKLSNGDYSILDPGGYEGRTTIGQSSIYKTIYRYMPITPNIP